MADLISRTTRGVYIICATPFFPDGRIDFASLDRLIDFYLEKGVNGLTVLGMMGEADKLTPEERRRGVRPGDEAHRRAHSGGGRGCRMRASPTWRASPPT